MCGVSISVYMSIGEYIGYLDQASVYMCGVYISRYMSIGVYVGQKRT